MEIVSMTCPNCMGHIKPIGNGYGQCEFCGAKFKLSDDDDFDDEEFDEEDEDFDAEAAIDEFIGSRECPPVKDMTDLWYGTRLEQDSDKISAAQKYLGVPTDEDVILLVDNTMFHNGKKGLAITEYGIYLRDEDNDLESYTWDEFWDADVDPMDGHPSIDDYYWICDSDTNRGLINLFDFLQDY